MKYDHVKLPLIRLDHKRIVIDGDTVIWSDAPDADMEPVVYWDSLQGRDWREVVMAEVEPAPEDEHDSLIEHIDNLDYSDSIREFLGEERNG